ncbi:MAG: aldolase/citrate lyase family protein [Albidovulum sp.]|nr:aldolase/citrate lyase family protein [Albidovulum sp.]
MRREFVRVRWGIFDDAGLQVAGDYGRKRGNMIPNKLKILWGEGRPVINGWLSIPCGFSAEVMAEQGYDSLTVDTQHGVIDYPDAVAMLQAMRSSGVVPLARVPWLEPGAIMKALDAGAYGVVCPMINNRKQAEELVSSCRYPPLGMRSFGPTRANISAGPGYASSANDEIICLAMVETAEAIANIEEIVSTPGLDAIYIGPADLTLGIANGRIPPGFDSENEEVVSAIKMILDAAKSAGIRAGLHCGSPEYAAMAVGWGFDLVTILNDARILAAGAKQSVVKVRELLGEKPGAAVERSSSY